MKKKTKRPKPTFNIPLTRKNMSSLNNLMKDHISNNQFYKNEEKVLNVWISDDTIKNIRYISCISSKINILKGKLRVINSIIGNRENIYFQ